MSKKILFGSVAGISAFFIPLYTLLFWMFIFVVADTASGMLAAKKRGEKLTSAKLKRIVSKIIWYSTCIILVHGLDVGVLPFIDLYASQVVTGIICGVEMYSNLENLYGITGNKVFWLLTQWTAKKIHETGGVDITNEKEMA